MKQLDGKLLYTKNVILPTLVGPYNRKQRSFIGLSIISEKYVELFIEIIRPIRDTELQI